MSAVPAARHPPPARPAPDPWPRVARVLVTWGPWVLCGVAALAVGALFVWKLRAHKVAFGFPLDDAYIYMTYAKQVARARPFTYFDGGGYSAGATSMLWPLLEAPLWAIGFRGQAFAYAVFGLCVGLLGVTLALALAIGRRTLGLIGGAAGAAWIASSGPTCFGYLAGMEVPIAGALLLLAALLLLGDEERAGRPSRRLLVVLALAAVGRPEAGLLIAAVVGVRALDAARRRRWGNALRWLSPLLLPLAIAGLNQLLAGHSAPNTAVAKSHLYLPGFDWVYYREALVKNAKLLGETLFWKSGGPLPYPKLLLVLWACGAARLIVWGARARRLTGALLLVLTPPVMFATVLLASGDFAFHNYRYLSSAFPSLFVVAGLAVAPPSRAWVARLKLPRPAVGAIAGIALALAPLGAWAQRDRYRLDLRLFAQSTADINAHTVRIGRWMAAHLPANALVAMHDVGGPGYYGERRLVDIIGLVSKGWAEICNHGPGARYEALERLPPARRPTHFAYYPGWLLTGAKDLFGATLFTAGGAPTLEPGKPALKRLVGGSNMLIMEARWDVLGSGAAPLELPPGWTVGDTLDHADQVSERAHGWRGDLGRRTFGAATATWSVFFATDVAGRRVADGGRTIRGPRGERFKLRVPAGRAARLVLRVGGPVELPYSRVPAQNTLRVHAGARPLGEVTAIADGTFHEVALDLPSDLTGEVDFTITAPAPYRIFHAFVLQPQ